MKNRWKRNMALIVAVCMMAGVTGCKEKQAAYDITAFQDDSARKEFNESLDFTRKQSGASAVPDNFSWKGEAEDAKLTGNVKVQDVEYPGYSGKSYVGGFAEAGDTVIFSVEIPVDGVYDLHFATLTGAEDKIKINPVTVDGENVGSITSPGSVTFVDAALPDIYLTAGTHEIAAGTEWGWYYVDYLTVTAGMGISDEVYEVSASLSDPEAFDNSKRLYQFLKDCYGIYTITGQFCDGGKYGKEMTLIHDKTGHYPAMLGLDMIEYSPSRVEFGSSGKSVEYAKDFYLSKGGIVTMCWHWNAPTTYLINSTQHPWYSGFYKEATTINLDAIAEGKDEAGVAALKADIDAICLAMEPLKEAQVPILWRPLHEASGGWFWWGDCKKESYLWLWNLVYDKMVHEHGMHNLIWVWNGQDPEWYPGDDTVDIVGTDIYPPAHSYASQSSSFAELAAIPMTRKIVALTENGVMPDPDLLQRDNAIWSWFATWGGEFIQEVTLPSEKYTEFSMWEKVYQSEHTLALEDLPCLWTYPLSNESE